MLSTQFSPVPAGGVPRTFETSRPSLSCWYSVQVSKSCLLLLKHCVRSARSLAVANAGKSNAARIAMIAITTSSSINVNPMLLLHGLMRQLKIADFSR